MVQMPARWPLRFSPADLSPAAARPAARAGAAATAARRVKPAPGAEPAASSPVFRRIAELVIGEIRRGRLRAGARLPATRDMARMLAVNRNTVVAAYDELAGE